MSDYSASASLTALVAYTSGTVSGEGEGPRTALSGALVVYQDTPISDSVRAPVVASLVVYEDGGPTPGIEGTRTPLITGLSVYGTNVREQLNTRSWGFELDGHVFIVYAFGMQGTYVYDATTNTWSQWSTQGYAPLWNAELGIYWYDGRYVAADIQGPAVVELDFDSQLDDDFRSIQRVVTAIVTLRHRAQNLAVGALHLDASTGAPSYNGPNPPGAQISLRYSDDEGVTWTEYDPVDLVDGVYNQDVQWRSLGTIFAPGRVFEVSDEGGTVRIDGAQLDVGGRDGA